MKILITGGLGFVGSHLVDLLLEEKHKIIIRVGKVFLNQEQN